MSAQRASAPVRLVRLAAAVGLVVLAVVIILKLTGRREGPAPAPVEPPPEGRIVDLKERVRQQEYKDGRPVVDIRGAAFFRGPDGRNHLSGSVEVVNLGPDGKTLSRLSADEVVYDPGSLLFTITGHVRVEAAGVVLEGGSFNYDKTKGLFETTGGGRFSSATINGAAPEILYAESTDELRLGGGFLLEIANSKRTEKALSVSGRSLVYARRERRGLVDGQANLSGGTYRGTSAAISFIATRDEAAFDSAVLEGAAKVVFGGTESTGEGSGEVSADRIAIAFARDPIGLLSIETSGRSSLLMRSAADRTETVLAPTAVMNFDRVNGLWTWSASGGIRAEIAEAGGLRRALEGDTAVFDSAKVFGVSGGPGRPAVADAAEARIEAPKIFVAAAGGDILASGGAVCVLKRGEGRRTVGFFSPLQDVSVSSETLDLRPETSTSSFTGNVVIRQGADTLRAGKVEIAGDRGRMSGGGGVAVTLTEAVPGDAPARTVETGGQNMVYQPDMRTLTLTSKAYVRLPEARLEAATISAVIGREGQAVESLAASTGVSVSNGRYVGRSESASYQAATGRIILIGRPVLTDDKGGSARGGKLTFDLTDDKILIENEGPGRATTVVRS